MDFLNNPDLDLDGTVFECFFCKGPESPTRLLKRCSGCQLVTYCSKDCQQDDWKAHKPVCKEFPVVNGKNVYHTTGSWENHIAGLRERAAQLPDPVNVVAKRVFCHPKVCSTCQESQPDRLKVCQCTLFCFCSKACTLKDRNHTMWCSLLGTMVESMHLEAMQHSYPLSLWKCLDQIIKTGWNCSTLMCINVLEIHIVTSTTYFDARIWEFFFHKLHHLEVLELVFIIQGTDYDPSLDCSRTRLPSLGCKDCDSRDRVIQYSVHQKPYHMYFSSSEYVEPDFVVTYGIPHKKDDVHNEISYRNMTHSYGSVLVLMDSTKDLLTQAVKDVKAAQPTSVVLLSPERNTCRGFGSHLSMLEFSANAPNLKYYMAGLYRPKRADESSSEKTLVGCPIIPL